MEKNNLPDPPDQKQRNIILHELDKTILVEAAAGTGKTTTMIGRMVNLLATGRCSIDRLAAVTFTRKAAAELRARFQTALEKAAQRASFSKEKKFLALAINGLERCFIGTIHSFCARMLRERPVEADVDIEFQEMDETEDESFRKLAWQEYLTDLYSTSSPILAQLEDLGVEISDLESAFTKLADFPDIECWPARQLNPPDTRLILPELEEFVRHMETFQNLPEDPGNDKLIPKYRIIPLMFRQIRKDKICDLMDVLGQFKALMDKDNNDDVKKLVQKNWPEGGAQAKEELARWNDFSKKVEPLVKAWLEYRYYPLLQAIKPALKKYDELKIKAGRLNYQDLLLKAARLLRDKPPIRKYFRERFTHILVDEFQDTDPIQAEVLLLLTSQDLEEKDWRKCRPEPGSLFVVGDPKQSIYRFRRADIVTYNQVKSIIKENGGEVVTLSANFRTITPLVEWVNSAFADAFAALSPEYSPEYVPLLPVKDADESSALSGVRILRLPSKNPGKKETNSLLDYEAELLARIIRNSIDNEIKIPRLPSEIESDVQKKVNFGDFLIITPTKKKLGAYSAKLQEFGIPHQVTGGDTLNKSKDLFLLYTCLVAVLQPHNPVALVAVLRSELFGVSDPVLYNFKRLQGKFSYYSDVPAGLDPTEKEIFSNAFDRMRKYSLWIHLMPPIPAIEKIISDLGLGLRSAAISGKYSQAGGLYKAVELLRQAQSSCWTAAEMITYLDKIIHTDETHDAIPVKPHLTSVTRIMNLHKVKGLEAPIVFLADPRKQKNDEINLCIDRSGPEACGYICITGQGRNQSTVLAKPEQWDELAEKEEKFQEAEKLRLLYVAATRAGCSLTITQRSSKDKHLWDFFDGRVPGREMTVEQDSQQRRPVSQTMISDSEVLENRSRIQKNWARALEKTYETSSVKTATVRYNKFPYSHREHGTEWGSAIHAMLYSAMLNPDADLNSLAASALAAQDLSAELIEEAVETVQSVTQSMTWQRAMASERKMMEVPFQILISRDENNPNSLNTILRGVIDLLFRESEGWVIVDYKSDRVSTDDVGRLVNLYSPQVRSYAHAWTQLTREPVKELGLYFTHCGKYIEI